MSTVESINKRNSLWRRMTGVLSRSSISRLLRSFQSAITCGKSKDVVNNPRHTGSKITVPRTGEPFQYPEDRYLSNAELGRQLNLLEMRFNAQSCRLDESKNEERKITKMAKAARASTVQFQRLEEIVNAIQENNKVNSASCSMQLK